MQVGNFIKITKSHKIFNGLIIEEVVLCTLIVMLRLNLELFPNEAFPTSMTLRNNIN